jgi:hypothetical protein
MLTAQWVLAILGVRAAVAFPMSVFGAVNTARQRFALTSSIAIVVTVLQAVATVPRAERRVRSGDAGDGHDEHRAWRVTSRTRSPRGGHVPRAAALGPALQHAQVREVTAFSAYVFLITIAIQLGYNMDNVVIGALAGTSAVAVYAVAFRLADYQRQLCNQFNGLLFPVVVRFDAGDQQTALRATLIDGTRIALGLIAGVSRVPRWRLRLRSCGCGWGQGSRAAWRRFTCSRSQA